MIDIRTIGTSGSESVQGGSGGGGGTYNATIINTGVQGVYLWGRYHDHTKDISGDLEGVGNITATGSITTDGNISTTFGNITTQEGDLGAKNAYISGTTETDTLKVREIQSQNIYNEGIIRTNEMNAITGYIKNLISGNITCDNLTVTKAAHFFKLIIDEIKSTMGIYVLSVGNTELDHVGHINNTTYRCFFKTKDATGRQIYNVFEPNDQVVCQTFNATEGVSYNVSNKWYWMLCTNTGTTTTVSIASDSVNNALVDAFDTDSDGLLSTAEFNAIHSLSTLFQNSGITDTFDEFQYMNVSALTENAFLGSNLTSIYCPEALKTIGNNCFKNCSNLASLTLPTQLTSIGDYAFENCNQLTQLIILRGTIGEHCFKGCNNITYLQLPEGLTHLTKETLEGLQNLQSLVLPSTVTSIDEDAFEGLMELSRVYIKAETAPLINVTVSGETAQLFEGNPLMTYCYVPEWSCESYLNTWEKDATLIQPYRFDEMGTDTQHDVANIAMDYHFLDLTTEDKDPNTNSVPERYDSIAVLGNRYDEDRQNAILLGAYNSAWLDPEIKAPFICQYAGIDTYSLANHRLNIISNGKNEFIGHFTVIVNGEGVDLEDYVEGLLNAEIITDSQAVFMYTDNDGYITSLRNVKGLPTMIMLKIGKKTVPIHMWKQGSYIKYNDNSNDPLR